MLEVKPVRDTSEQKAVCEACGIAYLPGHFVYGATEDGALVGASLFDITGEGAVVEAIRPAPGNEKDFEGLFILGRGTLNFLDLCGVKQAVMRVHDETDTRLSHILGFRDDGTGTLRLSLVGLFDADCAAKKKEEP